MVESVTARLVRLKGHLLNAQFTRTVSKYAVRLFQVGLPSYAPVVQDSSERSDEDGKRKSGSVCEPD